MNIPDCITRARSVAGVTQQQLADAVGVHRVTVDAWEHGRQFPRADKLLAICEALGISIGQLFPNDGTKLDLTGLSTDTIKELREYVEFRRSKQ